jgi:alkylated DNA nucleotide flippase Atl1
MTKPPELPPYVERVFAVVERIPPGRVMAYGDIASWLGEGGARQVGTAMAKYGGGSPWWRVVRSDGGFLPGHEREALANYREEGTPLKPDGGRLDMARARGRPAGGGIGDATGDGTTVTGGGAMDEVPSDFAGE